jgi:hypothetical protein
MLDREKIVAVLKRRFPGAAADQVAAATNAIVGLDDDWVEVSSELGNRSARAPLPCRDSCYLATATRDGASFRVFRRVENNDHES